MKLSAFVFLGLSLHFAQVTYGRGTDGKPENSVTSKLSGLTETLYEKVDKAMSNVTQFLASKKINIKLPNLQYGKRKETNHKSVFRKDTAFAVNFTDGSITGIDTIRRTGKVSFAYVNSEQNGKTVKTITLGVPIKVDLIKYAYKYQAKDSDGWAKGELKDLSMMANVKVRYDPKQVVIDLKTLTSGKITMQFDAKLKYLAVHAQKFAVDILHRKLLRRIKKVVAQIGEQVLNKYDKFLSKDFGIM